MKRLNTDSISPVRSFIRDSHQSDGSNGPTFGGMASRNAKDAQAGAVDLGAIRGAEPDESRFLINAIGSTAVKIAWQIKRCHERMMPGAAQENVSYFGIDAAGQQSSRFEADREFFHTAVDDVEGIMQNLPRHKTLSNELPGLKSIDAVAKIQDGVHGQPIYGTFALMQNAREVSQAITAQLTRLGGNITVLHIISPLGGVATGMLTREVHLVRTLCREVLASQAHHHVCFLMLPVKGEQTRSSDREELIQIRNYYFALRQIETFTKPGQVFRAQMADNQICTGAPLFDLVIGLGPNLERNHVATDLAELEASAASIIARYMACGLDEVLRHRLADHKSTITGRVGGKSRRLAISGQISLEVPVRQIRQALAHRAGRKLLAEIAPVVASRREQAGENHVIDGAGLTAESLAGGIASSLKKNVQTRPESLSLGKDPQVKLNDHHNDLVTQLNSAVEEAGQLQSTSSAEKFTQLTEAAPRGNQANAWWAGMQAELEYELEQAVERSKKAEHTARQHRRASNKHALAAKRIMSNFLFAIFRSPEADLNAAVEHVYKSRDQLIVKQAFDAARDILRDVAAEIRRRRKALLQLSRASLKRTEDGEQFSAPAHQTVRIVDERHLDALEAAFAPQDDSQAFAILEKRNGPMIEWGVAFADRADEFLEDVGQAQLSQFASVLKTSAVDYLAGPMAESLGINPVAVFASARRRLTPSANYTLAAVPDEHALPKVLLASYASSADAETNSRMQQLLDLRENCIQEKGHPEHVTLMVIHLGASFGMLVTAGSWRHSFRKALELEGDDVLQIYADRKLEELAEPVFDEPDAVGESSVSPEGPGAPCGS